MNKKYQCQAFTMKKSQCVNKCINTYCGIHDPKKCEKRMKIRQLNRELLEREHRFLKYVERELKKERIKHKKFMERSSLIQHNKCKATTRKGSSCKNSAKLKYCHIHNYLDADVLVEELVPCEKDEVTEIYEELSYCPILSFRKELENESHNVELRQYSGPKIDSHRMGKINKLYLSEKESKIQFYHSMISMLSAYSNSDEIDLDSIKEEVKLTLKFMHKKTDSDVKIFSGLKR